MPIYTSKYSSRSTSYTEKHKRGSASAFGTARFGISRFGYARPTYTSKYSSRSTSHSAKYS